MKKHDKYIEHYPNDKTIQAIRDYADGKRIYIVDSFEDVLARVGLISSAKYTDKQSKHNI